MNSKELSLIRRLWEKYRVRRSLMNKENFFKAIKEYNRKKEEWKNLKD